MHGNYRLFSKNEGKWGRSAIKHAIGLLNEKDSEVAYLAVFFNDEIKE